MGAQLKWVKKQNWYIRITVFFAAVQQTALFSYLGVQAFNSLISIGDFQMYITAANSFASSLSRIIEAVLTLRTNANFMNEYRNYLNLPDKMQSGTIPIPRTSNHVLEFKNVSFKYPNTDDYVLRHICITIPSGQKLSIVGRNGAGKTTFIKLLCRLYDPTEGEIMLDGIDIRQYNVDEYQKLLSVVFQDYQLIALTIRDNLAFGV